MAEFRKTLQTGTPAAATGVPGADPSSSMAGEPPMQHFDPPPPGSEELRRTRPPEGKRTPSHDGRLFGATPALPDDAPGWMQRARRMTLALEEAIRSGIATPNLEACIERAYAAWELDGVGDKRIARVAGLVEQARTAIRATAAQELERAYGECSQVLWAGLPRSVKARQDPAVIHQVVRGLRSEADAWAAVVDGTAKILGWCDAARGHSAHAVRVAILAERQG
ncbi:MAG TPA: hypothetical protein VH062_11665 [Polyangiaceae bacterium]|jgi:hypothetical protein|nr:hypothetical protein [Polyangiaceae bacterium]